MLTRAIFAGATLMASAAAWNIDGHGIFHICELVANIVQFTIRSALWLKRS
jgi:hypothetical protein